MTEDVQIRCSKPDCQVSITGSCAEGHDPLASCPNFGQEPIEDEDEFDESFIDEEENPSTDHPGVRLPDGEALTPDALERFKLGAPVSVISIIGDSHSGKTTLLCSLYDRFLRGPFSDHLFSGSRSLVALEKRLHFSRIDSGRSTPETQRTSISDGLRYFHFSVSHTEMPSMKLHIMLSDRAGESYKQARDNTTLVKQLIEIPSADRVVILLDGSKVADPIERAGAIQAVRQTLRVLLDNGALNSSSIVQVVTTKFDLLVNHAEGQELNDILENFNIGLTSSFSEQLSELSFWKISARDPSGQFEQAYGVDRLFSDWCKPKKSESKLHLPPIVATSEFERLSLRTPLEEEL